MWLSRIVYQDLRESLVAAQAERDTQHAIVAALNTTMDWFRVRITQLEHERALMLQNYLGVTVPAMSIDKVETPAHIRPNYDPAPHFEGMGDEEAKQMGVEWNPLTGEVAYRERE